MIFSIQEEIRVVEMKPNSLQNCRRNSLRLSPDSSVEGVFKSPLAFFWVVLHCLCCLVSLVLGFRFSRLFFLLIFAAGNSPNAQYRLSSRFTGIDNVSSDSEVLKDVPADLNLTTQVLDTGTKSSRVHVGRHGILIRPWPHPDPKELMDAHRILERVQTEQRTIYGGVLGWKPVIVITPTYVRTFQSVHLSSLKHTLMVVPGKVVWIVVEAGGVSNETARILNHGGSGFLDVVHVGFGPRMPVSWDERHRMETQMRIQGLRIVREQMLDGIIMFADDSNTHSLEMFDEIQSVKWMGSLSMGILAHPGNSEISRMDEIRKKNRGEKEDNLPLPVQGPACNSSGHLVGWHTFNSIPYEKQKSTYIGDGSVVLPRRLEWAGFMMNSKLISKNADKPSWFRDWDDWCSDDQVIESPLSLLKDDSFVEPLGRCGRKIMLWWARVEARSDSKFPSGWIIDPPLDIVVPAKHTPWPDPPPPAPPVELNTKRGNSVPTEKRVKSGRPSRTRRHKRKRDAQIEAQQVSQVSERDGTN